MCLQIDEEKAGSGAQQTSEVRVRSMSSMVVLFCSVSRSVFVICVHLLVQGACVCARPCVHTHTHTHTHTPHTHTLTHTVVQWTKDDPLLAMTPITPDPRSPNCEYYIHVLAYFYQCESFPPSLCQSVRTPL